jgi:colanic acid/amylovoran biosynthesis glycosyltransferase
LPLVTSFYGVDASRLVKTEPAWIDKYKTLFSEGKAFIAEGIHMGDVLEGLGCPREKINVLRLGVDLNKLPYKERCSDGEIRVLAAGTFREKKGHPFTVQAVGLVARKHPNISLTIIGDAAAHRTREVEEKKKILAAIERAGLAGRTRLLGFQPYDAFIRELLNHHIFVSPSVQAADGDNEGGAPVSITEASATGMPVLSTTHCDIPEVVLDGKSGYLVPERDADTLAERLSFLIENPQTWPTLGACGRAHIEEHYDLRKQVPKLERVYHGVLANSTESSREA